MAMSQGWPCNQAEQEQCSAIDFALWRIARYARGDAQVK